MARNADEHLGYVVLYPDGSLGATDGVSMLMSRDAHDADVDSPLYIKGEGSLSLSKTADSYALSDDMVHLIERRPRSEATFDVSVQRGVKMPDLHRAVPTHLTPVAGEAPAFDSIVGGRIASDYGLDRGVWSRGPWADRVYLEGVDEGDLIVLAGIRREVTNED